MSTPAPNTPPVARYIVEFWQAGVPAVTYSAALGATNARKWAIQAAQNRGGQVLVEYADGKVGLLTLYGGRLPTEAPKTSSKSV